MRTTSCASLLLLFSSLSSDHQQLLVAVLCNAGKPVWELTSMQLPATLVAVPCTAGKPAWELTCMQWQMELASELVLLAKCEYRPTLSVLYEYRTTVT